MKTFRFYWTTGHISEGTGSTLQEAFSKSGYGVAAIQALAFWQEIKEDSENQYEYEYDKNNCRWMRKS